MIEVSVTKEFEKRYKKLPISIKQKAEKREKLFKENFLYPSLHTEKLNPRHKQVWSFRIDKQYRIIFKFIKPNKALFLTIGHHSWIYRYTYN